MNEDKYRESFNKLAIDTFDINFERWYKNDLFFNKYCCYSYIDGDKVISNVSTNRMELIMDGQRKNVIQLGTVMTDPDYRNKGLAAALIKQIIEKYENECDFMYLLANDTVLDFYPKFGFNKVIECAYEMDTEQTHKVQGITRKLCKDNEEDYKNIVRLISNRIPISKKLGVCSDMWPLLVYCTYMFKEALYYLEDDDLVVVAEREEGKLHLYDVISLKPFDLDSIIEKIITLNDKTVEFHFIPELYKYSVSKTLRERQDETLFIRTNSEFKEILFPMTSHT
jgi:predicted N-acetyltransferase YhbS